MITTNHSIHFRCGIRSKKTIATGVAPKLLAIGRIPRVSKILALAIRLDRLSRDGEVTDQAELARLG